MLPTIDIAASCKTHVIIPFAAQSNCRPHILISFAAPSLSSKPICRGNQQLPRYTHRPVHHHPPSSGRAYTTPTQYTLWRFGLCLIVLVDHHRSSLVINCSDAEIPPLSLVRIVPATINQTWCFLVRLARSVGSTRRWRQPPAIIIG